MNHPDIGTLAARLARAADAIPGNHGILGFEVTGQGFFRLEMGMQPARISMGPGRVDCTIILAFDDLYNLCTGTLDTPTAFRQGRFTIRGNMDFAFDFELLFAQASRASAMAGSKP
jgi:hypothetical protein